MREKMTSGQVIEELSIEEAIECNKNLRMYMKLSDKNQPCKFLEENYIALNMAIEALKFQGKAEVVISQLREDRDRLLTILERIEKYLNNPNSGVNGLVHIDDVRGVMEDYEA